MKFNMNITAWSPTHLGPFYFLLPVPTMQVHEVGATLEPFLKFHMVTELWKLHNIYYNFICRGNEKM